MKKIKEMLRRIGIAGLAAIMLTALMPGMGLTAYAAGEEAYAAYDVTTEMNKTKSGDDLKALQVTFNGRQWYIIEDNSSGATSGTVTLLSADTSFGTKTFDNENCNKYSTSQVKAYLDSMTGTGGAFANAADAIETVNLTTNQYNSTEVYETVNGVKLYLLSTEEASSLPVNVRKAEFTGGDCDYNQWRLRSPGYYDYLAACVFGSNGSVNDFGDNAYYAFGVRPALKLNLESVIFSSESKTFTVGSVASYSVTITPGSNMTRTTGSGAESQAALFGAMTDVVYTANEGYKFPETSDAYTTTNGITVTRTSNTEIKVSGTPTANTTISIPDAVENTPYAALVNTTTVVKFDGKDWYLIKNNSTAVDAGTVTLLSKECVAASQYNSSGSYVEYDSSTIKTKVDDWYKGNITDSAKEAVVDGKMFLLTKDQANATNAEVRKCSETDGAAYNYWWLCSPGYGDNCAACVSGGNGLVDVYGLSVGNTLGVRPALKLNLESVIFSSETNTFTVGTAASYSVIITAGSNMTKTTGSGAESQADLSGAMTDVVYTANEGYKFPETSDAYTTKNGITVTRTSGTEIKVSGTPTANTTISIPDAVEDAASDDPYAVTVINGSGGGNYVAGASVTITADAPESGKQFKEWTGADDLTFTNGGKTASTATFTMPAREVSVTAVYEAGEKGYAAYDVTTETNKTKSVDDLKALQVTFNGRQWYIIEYNSSGATSGTVTLLSADTSFGTKTFDNENYSNKYSTSQVKAYLDSMTGTGGAFADVADAIETVNLTTNQYNSTEVYETVNEVKLYLLSTEEASSLPVNVRKAEFTGGDCLFNEWWLRSPGGLAYTAACVYGGDGNVRVTGDSVRNAFGVRPALKLNLKSVIFSSESNTFNVINCEHSHTELINVKEATCTDTGYTGDTYCTDCNSVIATGNIIPINPDNHAYDSGVITKQPTIFAEGIRTYTCTRCHHTYTETIPKIDDGEDHSELIEDITDKEGKTKAEVKVEDKEDGSKETTVTIGGQEVEKTVKDAEGNEAVETRIWIGGLKSSYTYTGSAIKPSFHVYDGTKKLTSGKDYSVSYKNNKNAGAIATITVTFKGNYKGTSDVKLHFDITSHAPEAKDKKHSLSKATVKLSKKKYDYTGKEIIPAADTYTLKLNGKTLKEGEDFTVSVTNNVGIGTATILFSAIKDNAEGYGGTKTATFRITGKKELKEGEGFTCSYSASVPYAKGGAKPAVIVKDGNDTLKAGTDYTVSYSKNTKVTNGATAVITINGKGNYKGSIKKYFTITKQDISKLAGNIITADKVESKKGYNDPTVTITDLDGKKLKAGTDFAIVSDSYSEPDANGVVTATVSGKGNYTGTASITYRYIKGAQQLGNVKAMKSLAGKTYTGMEVRLTNSDLTGILYTGSKSSPVYLIPGTDFKVVSYTNNTKTGTAKVTIQGIGTYGGTRTLSFKVIAKKGDYKGSLVGGEWQ